MTSVRLEKYLQYSHFHKQVVQAYDVGAFETSTEYMIAHIWDKYLHHQAKQPKQTHREE